MTCLAELRPSQGDGRRDSFHRSSSPNASAAAPHINSQIRMSHPVGACPLYFGIGSQCRTDNNITNIKRDKAKREEKDRSSHSRLADTKVWSIPSSNCF